MKKISSLFLVMLALIAFSAGSVLAAEEAAKPVDKGFLGDLVLKTATGDDFTYKNVTGKRTMFVIVQTACSQCKLELKEMTKEIDAITGKIDVYAVLVDMTSERAIASYNAQGFKLPILLDPLFKVGELAGVSATPATVIVDKDGKIEWTKTGYRPGQIEQVIEKL